MPDKRNLPVIAIAIGDAAGIGPEIVLKALTRKEVFACCYPLAVGDAGVLEYYARLYNLPLTFKIINDPAEADPSPGTIHVIDTGILDATKLVPGKNDPECGRAMLEYTKKAVQLAMDKKADAVIGAPHTKKSVEMAGIDFDGYPGYVSKLTGVSPEESFLMLISDRMRIVNTTLHVSLQEALRMIKKDRVFQAISATHRSLKLLGIKEPRIAVAGLNPHAGEDGMFGREEIEEIRPAVEKAEKTGIKVAGPFGADTMLLGYKDCEYDAYVAMYHDQAHIPVKIVSFGKISAMTIGIPVIFSTVGHGSAPDIAGKGVASEESLVRTIRLLSQFPINER